MARFSADIKERFFGSVRSTWSTVQQLTSFRPVVLPSDAAEMESGVRESALISSSGSLLIIDCWTCTVDLY